MDRATRNKMVSGTGQADLTAGNACWETPPLVFDKLNEDFGPFDVDLTADSQRHLCDVWFGPDSPYGPCGYDAPVDASPKLSIWEVPIHVTAQDLNAPGGVNLQPTRKDRYRNANARNQR